MKKYGYLLLSMAAIAWQQNAFASANTYSLTEQSEQLLTQLENDISATFLSLAKSVKSDTLDNANYSFTIPAKRYADLGVELDFISEPTGFKVLKVIEGSVAAEQALQVGDIITHINRVSIQRLKKEWDFTSLWNIQPKSQKHYRERVADSRQVFHTNKSWDITPEKSLSLKSLSNGEVTWSTKSINRKRYKGSYTYAKQFSDIKKIWDITPKKPLSLTLLSNGETRNVSVVLPAISVPSITISVGDEIPENQSHTESAGCSAVVLDITKMPKGLGTLQALDFAKINGTPVRSLGINKNIRRRTFNSAEQLQLAFRLNNDLWNSHEEDIQMAMKLEPNTRYFIVGKLALQSSHLRTRNTWFPLVWKTEPMDCNQQIVNGLSEDKYEVIY